MSHKIIIPITLGFRGRYKLIRRKACDESIVQETAWSKNLILFQGLDMIGAFDGGNNANNWLGGCVVGSGNTPPTQSDTSLETFVAGTGTVQSVSDNRIASPPSFVYTKTYRFGVGVAAGNLSEVGIARGAFNSTPNNSNPLFSRSLITDGMGNPITITVLGDKYLDVIYELTRLLPATDVTGTFSLNILGTPTNHDYVIRPAFITSGGIAAPWKMAGGSGIGYAPAALAAKPNSISQVPNGDSGATNGSLGVSTSLPTGTSSAFTATQITAAYVPGNYYKDLTFVAGLNDGNLAGGISCLLFNINLGPMQMSLNPVIDKNASRIFDITIRVGFADAS